MSDYDPPMTYVIARNLHDARRYCAEQKIVEPGRSTTLIGSDTTPHRLRGVTFAPADRILYVEGWDEGRCAASVREHIEIASWPAELVGE